MRHFAAELSENGFKTIYVKLNDPDNTGKLSSELTRITRLHNIDNILVTEPSEYRVLQELKSLNINIKINILDDDRFYASHEEFTHWAKDKTRLRMENFYRLMRSKHKVLMNETKPEGGKWNYDKQNRNFSKHLKNITDPIQFMPDEITESVLSLVENQFHDHFGDLHPFTFATTRKQALRVLNDFIKHRLAHFGEYQDAMLQSQPYMYHSVISFYLNIGLLLPKEVINKIEYAYTKDNIPINSAEGFIRQILGWREYVRGIYWLNMPDYAKKNYFKAQRKLPSFFWSGETKLNCMHQCINQTREYAYAHHIQRLMVLGNFTLLTGINPDEVNEWYMIVYADAFEWVELPNVSGMILYADGGYLASKPYSAGGAYINKMSNYCESCHYDVKQKSGPDACPFNYLYWNFLYTHRKKLGNNQRLAMAYSTLGKMSADKIKQIRLDSKNYLSTLH